MRIIEITKTCNACPSQWEGKTSDDRFVYVRFRWGHLSITVSKPHGDLSSAVRGECIFSKQIGDGFDGVLSYDELRDVTQHVIVWPQASPVSVPNDSNTVSP